MRAGKRGLPYLADPMPAFRRLCERAGLESLTIHDLRRSAGSWAAISGASMRTIAEVLGHAAGSSETAIYARLNQEAARVALSTAVDRMLALGGSIKLLTDVESAAPAPKTIDAESKPSDSTGSGE
jgi:hypothetical protein